MGIHRDLNSVVSRDSKWHGKQKHGVAAVGFANRVATDGSRPHDGSLSHLRSRGIRKIWSESDWPIQFQDSWRKLEIDMGREDTAGFRPNILSQDVKLKSFTRHDGLDRRSHFGRRSQRQPHGLTACPAR